MHTPLTQWSRSGLTMPLSRHSVGPVRKRAHTQFVREHSVTVVSVLWAAVDWSWLKEWNKFARANLQLKKKAQAGNKLSNTLPTFSHTKKMKIKKATTTKLCMSFKGISFTNGKVCRITNSCISTGNRHIDWIDCQRYLLKIGKFVEVQTPVSVEGIAT